MARPIPRLAPVTMATRRSMAQPSRVMGLDAVRMTALSESRFVTRTVRRKKQPARVRLGRAGIVTVSDCSRSGLS